MILPWWDRLALAVGKPLPAPVTLAVRFAHTALFILVLAEIVPEIGQWLADVIGRPLPTITGLFPIFFVMTAAIIGHAHAVTRRKQLRGEATLPIPPTEAKVKQSRLLLLLVFLVGAALMIWTLIQNQHVQARCEAHASSRRTYPSEVIPCPPEVSNPKVT